MFSEGLKAPVTELTGALVIAPFPFSSDSDTHNVAVPLADKNPKKVGIVGGAKFAFRQLDGASVYRITSECILKKMHFHAVTRAIRKRFGKRVRDFAFPEKEIFKRNTMLRRTDAVQHGRENMIAVFQRYDFVSFQKRRTQQVAHGADESVVADVVLSSDGMADFLFRGKEIPYDEQSCQTARRSCAEQLRPLS